MINLTLPDGSVRQIEAAQSAAEIIKGIGMGLYKAACCVKVNGEVKDLVTATSRYVHLTASTARRPSGTQLPISLHRL